MSHNIKNEEIHTIFVQSDEIDIRLDKLLTHRYEHQYSRSYFQYLIKSNLVLVNGLLPKKRDTLSKGDEIEVEFAAMPKADLSGEAMDFDIIFEDEFLLAINKPAGMVVHPAPGHWSGTFVNGLIHHCQQLELFKQTSEEDFRPGIVHRIDKNTSGVLLAAKTLTCQQKLIELFASRQIHKKYLAFCIGNPGTGSIHLPIGRHPTERQRMSVQPNGREAITHFKTLAYDEKISFVEISIATGRTHQIRVHMQHLGFPILGDEIYGRADYNKRLQIERQYLHASELSFIHPFTSERIQLTANLPSDMDEARMKLLK